MEKTTSIGFHLHETCFVIGQANVEATIAKLRGNTGCGSDREVAILAAAVEEIRQTKQIDPFKETLVIQVVHYLVSTGNIVSTSGGSRYCTLFL